MTVRRKNNTTIQRLANASVHDWYRFVLSYPDHLVADMLEKFGAHKGNVVLDPFVGTGTTLVECKKKGIDSDELFSRAHSDCPAFELDRVSQAALP